MEIEPRHPHIVEIASDRLPETKIESLLHPRRLLRRVHLHEIAKRRHPARRIREDVAARYHFAVRIPLFYAQHSVATGLINAPHRIPTFPALIRLAETRNKRRI